MFRRLLLAAERVSVDGVGAFCDALVCLCCGAEQAVLTLVLSVANMLQLQVRHAVHLEDLVDTSLCVSTLYVS